MRISIILLVFLMFGFSSLFGDEVKQVSDNLFETVPVNVKESLENDATIIINAVSFLSGKIIIIGDAEKELRFEYKKQIRNSSQSKAIEYSKLIAVESYNSSTGYNIILQTPNPAPWDEASDIGRIELVLHVPLGCTININATYFDLNVTGPINSLSNKASMGTMNIENVSSNLELIGSNRNISVKNIGGRISIIGEHSDIKAENIRSGKKAAYIKNESGNIVIDEILGAIEVKNSFGKIRITGAHLLERRSRILSDQCSVKMGIVSIEDTELTIGSIFADVELTLPKTVSTVFELNTDDDGEIHLTDIGIVTEKVRRNHLMARAGDGNSVIYIDNESGGDIFISGE